MLLSGGGMLLSGGVCVWRKRGMCLEEKGYVSGGVNFSNPLFIRLSRGSKISVLLVLSVLLASPPSGAGRLLGLYS